MAKKIISNPVLFKSLARIWKGKKVIVMGLGVYEWGSGWSSAAFFAELGSKVTVTDLKSKAQLQQGIKALKKYKIKYVLGRHRLTDFSNADLIVKNPVVKNSSIYLKQARKNNIPIETDISFFVQNCPSIIIGITGTRGKTTTATLIQHMLKSKWPNLLLGGNLGTSPLRSLYKCKKEEPVILELSSWMLESMAEKKISPHISLITNIYPDHLNYYTSYTSYIKAKANIVKYQSIKDVCFYNYDQALVRDMVLFAKSQKQPFSLKNLSSKHVCLHGNKIKLGTKTIGDISNLQIPGSHNIENAIAAVSVANHFKVNSAIINTKLKSFKGVHDRLEKVRKIGSITFYNDTTATIPEATISAIRSLPEPIVLIAGGTDKELKFNQLVSIIKKEVSQLILLPGTATQKIIKQLNKNNYNFIGPVKDMPQAVSQAVKVAAKNSSVLLSPASASFGLFINEFDRGKQFIGAVKKLK
ncbi:MAG: UDP-N-acetylmuramoyl-L-alanine--D-glutamate ligase [bacterium]